MLVLWKFLASEVFFLCNSSFLAASKGDEAQMCLVALHEVLLRNLELCSQRLPYVLSIPHASFAQTDGCKEAASLTDV